MLHITDNNGNIIAQLHEGSDTSWYEANGYHIIQAKDFVDPEEYKYIDGELAPVPDSEKLAKAKTEALARLRDTVNNFVERKPDGRIRYDTTLKLNLANAAVAALANGQSIPTPVAAVQQWIAAVQAAYFERKAAIEAATTLAELEAVDISYEWFESRYGLEGSVHGDPDVYTRDLLAKEP